MADSLRQKLKTASGQLASTSTEELAAQAGLPASPISPAAGAAIGVSPDQAKMLGTKAQKIPALRGMIQGERDLATRTRLAGPRTAATAEEKAKLEEAQQAQGLGGLQGRVQQLAQQKLQAGVQAAGQQLQAQGAAGLSTTGAQADIQPILDRIKANPNDQQALAELTNKLNLKPGELTEEKLSSLLGGQNQLAGATAAQAAGNQVQTSELPPDVQTAAQQLLDKDVAGLTLDQLLDEINQEVQREYSQTSGLEAKLSDPYLGPAERAEARQQLRDAGAVGVRAAETDVDKLADTLQRADTIQFNGQDIPVEQMLADDHVAGVVANYLQDPNSDLSKMLKKNEPELVKFIEEYQPILAAATQSLGAGVAESAKIRQYNDDLANVELGNGAKLKLSDDVMKAVFPEWGKATGARFNPATSQFLTWVGNPSIPAQDKQALNSLLSQHPGYAAEIAKMSDAELRLNFSGAHKESVQKMLAQSDLVGKLDPANPYPDSVAQVAGYADAGQLEAQLQDGFRLARLQGTLPAFQETLAKLGIDAKFDENGGISVNYANTTNNLKTKQPKSFRELTGTAPALEVAQKGVGDLINNASATDKVVIQAVPDNQLDNSEEVANLSAQVFSVSDPAKSQDVMKTTLFQNAPDNVKREFENSLRTGVQKDVLGVLNRALPGTKNLEHLFSRIRSWQDVEMNPEVAGNLSGLINSLSNDIDKAQAAGNVVMAGEQRRMRDELQAASRAYETQVAATQAKKRAEATADMTGMLRTHLNQPNTSSIVSYVNTHANLTPDYVRGLERSIRDMLKASDIAAKGGNTPAQAEYDKQRISLQEALNSYKNKSRKIDGARPDLSGIMPEDRLVESPKAAVSRGDIVEPGTGLGFTR